MKYLQILRYVDAVARVGSIRKAAETLALTSTALNRQILAMEHELGYPIFERFSKGVRLSAEGSILIKHIRTQLTDLERVKGEIAELGGERRGHVSIACSQAMLSHFLPVQISKYRKNHPGVTFEVLLRDRAAAEVALADMTADIGIVFEPVRFSEFQVLHCAQQTIHAVMRNDHPLATKGVLRLKDCIQFPISLPKSPYGVRSLLEIAAHRLSIQLNPIVESDSFDFLYHHAIAENIVTFQLPIGLPHQAAFPGSISIPLDKSDAPHGSIYIGQLKQRVLPVAAAKFTDQIIEAFINSYDCR